MAGVAVLANDEARVFFPVGYRDWTVAKFKFVGPESPNYTAQGGVRVPLRQRQGTGELGPVS